MATNGLFSSPTDIAAVTKALSADFNNLDAAVAVAFEKLPTEAEIKRGTISFGVDTGSANAYLVALPYTPSGYVTGLQVQFLPLATNTGASTINVSGLGVKSIKRSDGTTLSAGDITVGNPVSAQYSSVTGFMHMAGNSSVDAAASAASAVASAASAAASSASAGASSASATASASSASSAATSATNASTSAATAATHATTATTQATNAATSATNAATSETNATTQASAAAASASTATTQASNAATSAATATTQAGNASTSATQAATSATNAATSETNAAASAVSAANFAAGLIATSTTSLLIATGAKTFTTQSGKQFAAGQFFLAVSAANSANYMHGQVTSYTGTSLVTNVIDVGGSGTLSDWNLSVSGSRGTTGATGATGADGASGALVKVEVSGTTQTASSGNDYWLKNVADTAVTANASPVDGERFKVTPANGLYTNTIDFSSANVIGPAITMTGVLTLNLGFAMQFTWSSAMSRWVLS